MTVNSEGSARPVDLKVGRLATSGSRDAFTSEIAAILELSRQQQEGHDSADANGSPTRARVTPRLLFLTAVAAVLAVPVAYSRWAPMPAPPPVPIELRGDWRTAHPKYRDRQLTFTSDQVGFALREGGVSTLYSISALSIHSRADTTRLAITYEDDGAPIEFMLNYVGGASPRIQLSNPSDVVWVPVRDEPGGDPVEDDGAAAAPMTVVDTTASPTARR